MIKAMNDDMIYASPLPEEDFIQADSIADDEVSVLGTDIITDAEIDVEVESASDFLGDDAVFVEIANDDVAADLDFDTNDDMTI